MNRKIIGTQERPRMSVYRSNKAIYVQIIDDSASKTLASSSSLDFQKGAGARIGSNCRIADAIKVGVDVAKKAMDKGINKIVFDRGEYKFHGQVKALADAAREKGLIF